MQYPAFHAAQMNAQFNLNDVNTRLDKDSGQINNVDSQIDIGLNSIGQHLDTLTAQVSNFRIQSFNRLAIPGIPLRPLVKDVSGQNLSAPT